MGVCVRVRARACACVRARAREYMAGGGGDTAVGGVVVVHSGDVRIGHKAARIKTMIARLIEGLFDGDFSHRWTLLIVTLILS